MTVHQQGPKRQKGRVRDAEDTWPVEPFCLKLLLGGTSASVQRIDASALSAGCTVLFLNVCTLARASVVKPVMQVVT